MKKNLLLLLPILATTLLPGCSNQSDNAITIWTTIGQNNRPVFESQIESFKEETGIEVDVQYISGDYNTLKDNVIQGFPANNYPDIVQCYPDHVAEYIEAGKAVNLDPYINDEEYGLSEDDKKDYIQTFLEEGKEYTVEGTYSLPYCKSTEAMYYNADVLIGLNLSSIDPEINSGKPLDANYLNNLTWEEFFGHLAPAILEYDKTEKDILKDDKEYHAVMGYDSDDNFFITLAEQYGYGYTDISAEGKGEILFNNDEMKALAKKLNHYANEGYILSKGSSGGNYTNELFTVQNTLFSIGSTGGVKYQFSDTNPMNVGVAKIPHAEGKDPKVINQGPSLTILDHGNETRTMNAWRLYKHLTNTENALAWTLNTGYMGIRQSVYDSDAYKEKCVTNDAEPRTLDHLMALNNTYVTTVSDDLFVSPAFRGSSGARQAVGGLMTSILTSGDSDLTDAEIDKLFTDAENTAKNAL